MPAPKGRRNPTWSEDKGPRFIAGKTGGFRRVLQDVVFQAARDGGKARQGVAFNRRAAWSRSGQLQHAELFPLKETGVGIYRSLNWQGEEYVPMSQPSMGVQTVTWHSREPSDLLHLRGGQHHKMVSRKPGAGTSTVPRSLLGASVTKVPLCALDKGVSHTCKI